MPNYDLSLSPSKLNEYNNCPLCFYMTHVLKVEKYQGIMASITFGIDRVLKAYANHFMGSLPPMLRGQVPGHLIADPVRRKKMQNWQSNIKPVVTTSSGRRVGLIGAFDELLENCPGYASLDWKSKGDKPKDDGSQYYQTQLDVYELMMKTEGWPTTGKGYLVYVWPEQWDDYVTFGSQVCELDASADRAMALIEQVVGVMEGEFIPQPSATCDLCRYVSARTAFSLQAAN